MDVVLTVGVVVIAGACWRLFLRLLAIERQAVDLRQEVYRLAEMRLANPERPFGRRSHPPK